MEKNFKKTGNVISNAIGNSGAIFLVTAEQLQQYGYDSARMAIESYAKQQEKESRDFNVTVNSAIQQLNVDRSTLWRWNKSGYLKHIEVGGKRYYKQSDIDEVLRSK